MFTSVSLFEKNWMEESKATQKVLDTLTDESLNQAVTEGHRTLGRMAWHIVTTIPEMMNRTGLEISEVKTEAPLPKTADEIKKGYATVSKALLDQIKSRWDDKILEQEDDMYGEKWKKGNSLYILLIHEIHHRGQMTVLMRQAGLKVPSIYGPAKEDWVKYGAPPPEI